MKDIHLKKFWAFAMLFSTLFICQSYLCFLSSSNLNSMFIYPFQLIAMDSRNLGIIIFLFLISAYFFHKTNGKSIRCSCLFLITIVIGLILPIIQVFWMTSPDFLVQHTSLTQQDKTYRVVSVRGNLIDPNQDLALYKCGKLGVVCHLEYTTSWKPYYGYSYDISLNVDSYTKQLQLRVNNEIIYVVDDFVETNFVPQKLPPLQPITVDNSTQLTELIRLPGGMIRDLDWSSDGQMLMISSSQPRINNTLQSVNGIWVYTLPDFERSFVNAHVMTPSDNSLASHFFMLNGEVLDIKTRISNDSPYLKQYDWLGYGNPQTYILQVYSASDMSLVGEITLPNLTEWGEFAIHPDGHRVAISSMIINLDGTETVKLQVEDNPNANISDEMFFSPDGNILAMTTYNKPVYLIENTTGEIRWEIGVGYEWALAFSPDSKLVAFAQLSDYFDVTEYDIKVYSTETGELVATLNGHIGRIIDIEFNPDRTLIASTSADGTIRLWGVPQQEN